MFLFSNITLYTLGKCNKIIWYSLKVVNKSTVFVVDYYNLNKIWSPFVLQFKCDHLWAPVGARSYQTHSYTITNILQEIALMVPNLQKLGNQGGNQTLFFSIQSMFIYIHKYL